MRIPGNDLRLSVDRRSFAGRGVFCVSAPALHSVFVSGNAVRLLNGDLSVYVRCGRFFRGRYHQPLLDEEGSWRSRDDGWKLQLVHHDSGGVAGVSLREDERELT